MNAISKKDSPSVVLFAYRNIISLRLSDICPMSIMIRVLRKRISGLQSNFLRINNIASCFSDLNILTVIRRLLSMLKMTILSQENPSFSLLESPFSIYSCLGVAIKSTSKAFCACRRLPACFITTECPESMIAAVTSSPRWAGRQCINR